MPTNETNDVITVGPDAEGNHHVIEPGEEWGHITAPLGVALERTKEEWDALVARAEHSVAALKAEAAHALGKATARAEAAAANKDQAALEAERLAQEAAKKAADDEAKRLADEAAAEAQRVAEEAAAAAANQNPPAGDADTADKKDV